MKPLAKCHYYREPERVNLYPVAEYLFGWLIQPTRGECLWYRNDIPVWVETADNRVTLRDCMHCECFEAEDDANIGI